MDINAPRHYGDTKMMELLIEKQIPWAEGNIIKYVYRWRAKDGLKDLYKAKHYLDVLIARAELDLSTTNTATQLQSSLLKTHQS